MKHLSLIICLSALFLSKASAQKPIKASQARLFGGQVVWIDDYVIDIKVASSSRVYIILGNLNPDSCITVILSGKGAYKKAMRLKKRTIAQAKGRIKIANGKLWMTVTDFRRLKIPNCNCFLGDKNPDVLVDTVAFPNEKKELKKPESNR